MLFCNAASLSVDWIIVLHVIILLDQFVALCWITAHVDDKLTESQAL
jgi:hypothetical protein